MTYSLDPNKTKKVYDLLQSNPSKVFNCKEVVEGCGYDYQGRYVSIRSCLRFLVSLRVINVVNCPVRKNKGYTVKNLWESEKKKLRLMELNNLIKIRKSRLKECKNKNHNGCAKCDINKYYEHNEQWFPEK